MQARVPSVEGGAWGLVEMSETFHRTEPERAATIRCLERLWMHEWREALEIDGVVVGAPHG